MEKASPESLSTNVVPNFPLPGTRGMAYLIYHFCEFPIPGIPTKRKRRRMDVADCGIFWAGDYEGMSIQVRFPVSPHDYPRASQAGLGADGGDRGIDQKLSCVWILQRRELRIGQIYLIENLGPWYSGTEPYRYEVD